MLIEIVEGLEEDLAAVAVGADEAALVEHLTGAALRKLRADAENGDGFDRVLGLERIASAHLRAGVALFGVGPGEIEKRGGGA